MRARSAAADSAESASATLLPGEYSKQCGWKPEQYFQTKSGWLSESKNSEVMTAR